MVIGDGGEHAAPVGRAAKGRPGHALDGCVARGFGLHGLPDQQHLVVQVGVGVVWDAADSLAYEVQVPGPQGRERPRTCKGTKTDAAVLGSAACLQATPETKQLDPSLLGCYWCEGLQG